jgi:hypothetical protein
MKTYLDKVIIVASDVLMVMTMQSMILWVVTPCSLDPPHLLGRSVSQARNQEKQTDFLLGSQLDSEDVGNMFL